MGRRVIAIDGPSASGKSSTARAVAARLGYRHLDSGALYRGVTLAALSAGAGRPFAPRQVLAAAARSRLVLQAGTGGFEVMLGGKTAEQAIRGPEVTAGVSEIASLADVREWVNTHLRRAAEDARVVVDGRDIGSVVFPDADLKIFLTASPTARARRRLLQRGSPEVDRALLQREAQALAARDRADSSRAVAPLIQAPDAILVDNSQLTFAEQVERIVSLARDRGLSPAS